LTLEQISQDKGKIFKGDSFDLCDNQNSNERIDNKYGFVTMRENYLTKDYFYWIFGQRGSTLSDLPTGTQKKNLVIRFSGGPGVVGTMGALCQDPFSVEMDASDAGPRKFLFKQDLENSALNHADLLYLDFPGSTGLSKCHAKVEPRNFESIKGDFAEFFSEFFRQNPKYEDYNLIIRTESYGATLAA
jgi:carboxypeptidase C (cathepsin A)